ncbi:MAG: M1 family metallopeptidase [Gemmatimonadota bacterium]
MISAPLRGAFPSARDPRLAILPLLAALSSACAGSPATVSPQPAAETDPLSAWPPPRPIARELTPSAVYRGAEEAGTRSASGAPGAAYWQQWTDHSIDVRVDPDSKRLEASLRMDYHNRSPDTLGVVVLELTQNAHASGARRLETMEVTGGVSLGRVSVDGAELTAGALGEGPAYQVDGSVMGIRLPVPLAPGASARIDIDYGFTIPQAGVSGRMGWSRDDFLFLAYWYPRMAVYDDIAGWATDQYLGAEFYQGYGNFEYSVTLPQGWVVVGTGELQNPEAVLAPHVRERLLSAQTSDEVVNVVTPADHGSATLTSADGWLTWSFRADSVRDIAFSATRASNWDAARSSVGDRDGDGAEDWARVDAIWREAAPRWANVWRYAQHAVAFHSRFTGQPYPWSHMSVVEGAGIIGGGMEFPMMTLIGDYNQAGDSALYYVTSHEIAHMWVPMLLANDERRFSWIDEGMTSFLENQSRKEFYPGVDHDQPDRDSYIDGARAGAEGSMMTRSDYHVPGPGFVIASYRKPATLLALLRGVLGDERFEAAYREFHARWRFKHPYPWDFFRTMEDVTGRDLSWFWGSFYDETWTVDHSVDGMSVFEDGSARITIRDLGDAPLPVPVSVTRADGSTVELMVPVERWLLGHRTATLLLEPGAPPTRVEASPSMAWPDVDRSNNVLEPPTT